MSFQFNSNTANIASLIIIISRISYKKMSLIEVMLACEGQKTRDRSSPQKLTQVNYHQNQKTKLCLSVTCVLSFTLVFLISINSSNCNNFIQKSIYIINKPLFSRSHDMYFSLHLIHHEIFHHIYTVYTVWVPSDILFSYMGATGGAIIAVNVPLHWSRSLASCCMQLGTQAI